MLDQIKQFVKESFQSSIAGSSVDHFDRTLHWLLQLKPDADEEMQIAAYAHDIARAVRTATTEETFGTKAWNDEGVLSEHQNKGAMIIKNFLEKVGYGEDGIKRIANMISRHEIGGDVESDFIKDADSISYLEVNAPRHVVKLVNSFGKDKVQEKIDWMYKRISSSQAREFAKPFYDEAIKLLKYQENNTKS